MTQNNHPGEASVMVARQLKIVSQSHAFMISATRNLQYTLKKLVGLIVFEKDIFDIYLNNICHIVQGFFSAFWEHDPTPRIGNFRVVLYKIGKKHTL